jgi:hypothetical protein
MTNKALCRLALIAWVLASGCAKEEPGSPAGSGGLGGATSGGVGGGGVGGGGVGGGGGSAGMTQPTGGMSGGTGGAGAGGMTGGVGGGGAGGMTGGSGDDGGMAGSDAAVVGGVGLLPTDDVTMDGPYTVTIEEDVDGNGWVFRPSELGESGETHPLLVWGNGTGATPTDYTFHLSRLASHGFVVYGVISDMVTGAMLTEGMDWLLAENERSDSALFGKLATDKISVGGHSRGSLETYKIASDPRITNTIHVDGGQFDGMGGERLVKPAIFICGDDSIAKPNCDSDYAGTSVPIFYTQIMGLSGIEGHVQAARQGIDIWVAWMRWTLAGEEERRADFLDAGGTFSTGKYISMSKNW